MARFGTPCSYEASLMFYEAAGGAPTWYDQTVAGPGTTYSAPAMIVNGSDVNIATVGPDNSLMFYWGASGSSTWHAETVASAGSAFSSPSMVAVGGGGHLERRDRGRTEQHRLLAVDHGQR